MTMPTEKGLYMYIVKIHSQKKENVEDDNRNKADK